MCNLVFISTDSKVDLSALGSDQFHFLRLDPADLERVRPHLQYPNAWFLECQYGGCSCHFRRLMRGSDFSFGLPEDWCPEDEDDIVSTAAVYDVLASLVRDGARLDLIDMWDGDFHPDFANRTVSISEVHRESFRFWEGYRFDFVD